jgi:hypothetical protein
MSVWQGQGSTNQFNYDGSIAQKVNSSDRNGEEPFKWTELQ